ncbi:hypothetical protein EDF46_1104 [Frondihabitans sp. PhB188]|uniref:hypothetical protein n=1 Tax=Frondihabitans sp. PhB188 TaxID=2485200 RepID=UPI000F9D2F3D|nr:hypothetical protein [Frondihabitans sp. PhB188]ROQ39472.1 hypothetical protein EDF46_1104 [Frondihabitans sp. PhB188]
MPSRPRRSVTRMTLDEAERIVALDRDGTLDRSEPAVDKVVYEAHRVMQRAAIWGSGPGHPSRRRFAFLFVGVAVFFAAWIAGLLVPLVVGS